MFHVALLLFTSTAMAAAAELDGVVMPDKQDRFLAAIPSVHKGDVNTLLFTARGVEFFINGRSAGHIANPDFRQVILSTFIGPNPTSEEVKAGLLGARG